MGVRMSITPAKFVLSVTGEASPELHARFIRDAEQLDGDLQKMLLGAESWARTKLNPNCPSPPVHDDSAVPEIQILRKAAFWDSTFQEATRKDLAELIRGTADDRTKSRVKKTLKDPASELSVLLEWLEQDGEGTSEDQAEE
jgi:hypothetical protein